MRKVVFLFTLALSIMANAQTVTQYFKSEKCINAGEKQLCFAFTKESNPRMLVPLYPFECDEYYIVLTKKKAKKFLDILKDYQKKMDKWQKTADKEHVTNLTKVLGRPGYIASVGNFSAPYEFAYTLNNKLYTVGLRKIDFDNSMIPVWSLEIDANGQCFISVQSILPTQTFTNNESLNTIDNSGGASITKKTVSITPAGKAGMSKDNLQWFINTIQEMMAQLDESKIENKKGKLFK